MFDFKRILSSLQDVSMNASVELVNQDLRQDVEKKLGTVRVTTRILALRETSAEALADWYFNMVNLNKAAFEVIKDYRLIEDQEQIQRLAIFLVQGYVTKRLSRAHETILHEQGHADAAKASGADDVSFGTYGQPDKRVSIGELYLRMLTDPGDRAFADSHFPEGTPPPSFEERASFLGAGINQQERFAEQMAGESLDRGRFHAMETIPYLMNKLILAGYYATDHDTGPEGHGDVFRYTLSLQSAGAVPWTTAPKHTMRKMAQYSVLTAALSGRTWEGLGSVLKYVSKGGTTVETFKVKTPLGDVTWPEFSTYLNTKSVSIKGSSRLQGVAGREIRVSAETSVIGEDVTEVSVGGQADLGSASVSLTGLANTRKGYGGRLRLGYRLGKDGNWILYGAAELDKDTLEGMRNHSTASSELKTDIYGGVERQF